MVRNLDLGRIAPMAFRRPPARTETQPGAAEPPMSFKTLMQQQPTPSPAMASASASPSTPSLHSVAALPNGGMMPNPTGNNPFGGTIAYNPHYYATAEAASQLAQQLGGTVVDRAGQISNNQAMYYIALPNGTTINAGNLLAVLNNAVFQENSGVMDAEIARLLNNNAVGTPGAGTGLYSVTNGRVSFDPSVNPTVYAT